MTRTGLSIAFAPEQATVSPQDLLLLEQADWQRNRLTRGGLAIYLARRLYSDTDSPGAGLVDCGVADGQMFLTLYAYPLMPDLRFRLRASVGSLSAGAYGMVTENESVQFNLETSVTLKHPAQRLQALRWLTGPWTTGGERVSAPALTVSGRNLSASLPLYGSVSVTTLVPRWTYVLTLDWEHEAQPALKDGWNEFAVAWPPPGRPVALELQDPAGAAEMADSGAGCGYSSRLTVNPNDNWPPRAPGDMTKTIRCNYCELECEDENG